ncbi:unnamed protein product [Staurois parvus]|uniref:Uncharacterized protein n=1 Tax=Staurois parvus TaxID=386267 RepID=A0ABN9BWR8_9NEOB|nr:unnamed protein product [Staurois parvus]
MSLFHIFKFPAVPSPVRPDVAGNGTQMTDADIGRGYCRGHCRGDIAGAQDKVSQKRSRSNPAVYSRV